MTAKPKFHKSNATDMLFFFVKVTTALTGEHMWFGVRTFRLKWAFEFKI